MIRNRNSRGVFCRGRSFGGTRHPPFGGPGQPGEGAENRNHHHRRLQRVHLRGDGWAALSGGADNSTHTASRRNPAKAMPELTPKGMVSSVSPHRPYAEMDGRRYLVVLMDSTSDSTRFAETLTVLDLLAEKG